jgi:uncharacterized protein (DUF58 family)
MEATVDKYNDQLTELQRIIRRVEIRSKRMASELFSGEYHSSFKGKGIEFSNVREYQYGDDVRSIDWNTSARKNELYVKLFSEERERSLLLVVDASGSMLFGSQKRSKRSLALEVSAVLASSALQNNDKVGLLVFTDRVEHYIPPRKGRHHLLIILDELLRLKPVSRKTDINAALSFIRYTRKRQEIIFLLTDLVDNDYEKGIKLLNNRHDFILVHISDPLDKALPLSALLDLEDPETGARLTVDGASRRDIARYREEQFRQHDELRQRLRRMRIDSIFLDTDRSFIGDLNTFFRYRERKV